MKKFISKDNIKRETFQVKEVGLNIRNILKNNSYLRELKVKNNNNLYNKIKNCCVMSGRARGINRAFKVSRNELFKKLKSREIEGLRRIYK